MFVRLCKFPVLSLKEEDNPRGHKDKIGLADQPLPNANRLFFGDDFPIIASKQADLSTGLAKNLGAASRPAKRPRLAGLTRRSLLLAPTLSTTTVQKTDVPFGRAPIKEAKESTHRQQPPTQTSSVLF